MNDSFDSGHHTAESPPVDAAVNLPAGDSRTGADDSRLVPQSAESPLRRPVLTPQLSGTQLRRWYWLRAELADLARQVGVSAAGSKQQLTDRLAATLDGEPVPPASPRQAASGRQLDGVLGLDTVIPVGQRCTQLLRAFFAEHVGPAFRFDGAMRDFIAGNAGSTLGDALAHWHATRSTAPREIDPQFELNRFTRQWYLDHPGSTRKELLQAWTTYRNTPTDQRPHA